VPSRRQKDSWAALGGKTVMKVGDSRLAQDHNLLLRRLRLP